MDKFDFTLPGLGRPKSSRPERVAEAVFQELSVLLRQKARDARLRGLSISKVQMSPDLKQAKIWFAAEAGADSGQALKALRRAGGFFRSHLARTLNLRYTPELLFFHDRQSEELERLEQLFSLINKERAGKDSDGEQDESPTSD
jgi:ribosome-binding factor A